MNVSLQYRLHVEFSDSVGFRGYTMPVVVEFFVFIAVILATAGHVPYFISAWRGKVQPHPYTWFIGSIVSGIVVAGLMSKGGGLGTVPVFVTWLFTVSIFFLSLKKGIDAIRPIDAAPLVLAIFGIFLWIWWKDPTYTIAIAVMIDLVSFAPTVRKTWENPSSEAPVLYGANVLRHVLIIASLSSFNFVTLSHSIAMIVANMGMYGLIVLRKAYNLAHPLPVAVELRHEHDITHTK